MGTAICLHRIINIFNNMPIKGFFFNSRCIRGFAYQKNKILSWNKIYFSETCIYFGPIISSISSVCLYFLTLEATGDVTAACLSSFFMALIPANISSSTAGKFEAESLIVFSVILVLYCWLKAVKDSFSLDFNHTKNWIGFSRKN